MPKTKTPPLHGYAAAVMEMFEGQLVEINTGEKSSTILFDQEHLELKHVIRGIVDNAIGDALIIKCRVPGGHKTLMINCWNIIDVAVVDGPGMLKDCYFNEHSSRNLK